MKIGIRAQVFVLGTLVSAIGAFLGCSDETTSTSASASTASSSSTSGSSSSSGDASTSSSSSSSGGQGGAGGGSGSGGAGGGPALINGCAEATAIDQTAMANVTITAVGFTYSPACVKVKVGTDVKFMTNFVTHPLVGGTVMGITKTPDPASPIKATSMGMMATFPMPNEGTFPFYCDMHAPGMAGAVFVVP